MSISSRNFRSERPRSGLQRKITTSITPSPFRSITTPSSQSVRRNITRNYQHPYSDSAPTIRNASSAREWSADMSEQEIDNLSEVIMAIDMNNKKTLGCAYYIAQEERLYFVEDVACVNLDLIDTVRSFVQPTVIIVSTKCNDELYQLLDPSHGTSDADASDGDASPPFCHPYLLERHGNADFGYDSARHKLANIKLGEQDGPIINFTVPGDVVTDNDFTRGGNGDPGATGKLLRLASWINLESRVTVGCCGAIVTYLQRRRTAVGLSSDLTQTGTFRIGYIEMTTISGFMFINGDTLTALQIISNDLHPNPQAQGPSSKGQSGGSKEGLSLYGLFHQEMRTPQGRCLLRRSFLRPSMDMATIEERLRSTSILLLPENSDPFDQIDRALGKIKDMHFAVQILRKGISHGLGQKRNVSVRTWTVLRHFVYFVLRLLDAFQDMQQAHQMSIYVRLIDNLERRGLATVGKMISETIDIESSKLSNRTVIQQGIDLDLDETKRTYNGLEGLLSLAAEDIAGTIPAELNAVINVIFFPQIGFLISIRRSTLTGDGVFEGADDDPWEKIFTTDDNAYYKSIKMTALDERFGDIYGQIADREIEIAQALATQILLFEDILIRASDLCAELDCLVAFAKVARRYGFVQPEMTTENIIRIAGGRHPIQELVVPIFVPNDTFLQGRCGSEMPMPDNMVEHTSQESIQGPSMVIMTGPNQSGKSVYLKQVAIIVYLAHIGSFVPAESATIGLTDKILTRITTRESVSRSASAFVIDLQQISNSLQLATERSLLLIDEFGKGTDTLDGAGLLAGVLEHLLPNPNTHAPKVICATHLHEIFESGFLLSRPAVQFAHMQVRTDPSVADQESQVAYLFQLVPSRSTASFGTYCATWSGIDPGIVTRAEELILMSARGEDLVEICAEMADGELDDLQHAEDIAKAFIVMQDLDRPRSVIAKLLDPETSSETVSERIMESCEGP